MQLKKWLLFTTILPVLHCGAQGIVVSQHRLDSVANPPLERNTALRFELEALDSIRLSEEDAPAVFTFPFRNIGDKPVVVTRIVTSCSCLTAEFDKAPVLPGKTGNINVVYKPAGQTGMFLRNIYVYTNASERHPTIRLRLAGKVTPRGGYPDYPAVMGPLRAKRTRVSFGDISRGEVRTERIECVNTGTTPLKLQAMEELRPEWLCLRTEPERIEPGATADLMITIQGAMLPRTNRDSLELAVLIEGLECPPSQRTLHIQLNINK